MGSCSNSDNDGFFECMGGAMMGREIDAVEIEWPIWGDEAFFFRFLLIHCLTAGRLVGSLLDPDGVGGDCG